MPEIEPHPEEMSRELQAIFSDKSSGEALDNIKSVSQGGGLWAYVKVYHWLCETSEQGRINRRIALMNRSVYANMSAAFPAQLNHEGRHIV